MKKLLFIALLSFFWGNGRAQKPTTMETTSMEAVATDSAAIANVLETVYFPGVYTGDVVSLRTIYHPGTLLFGDVKGQPYAKTLDTYLDGVKNRVSVKDSGKPFKHEIRKISVINSIAVAEVKVKMYDFEYEEFLSFHKLDGKWLIVNKMISDISK
jgi:hypothetical protein